MATSCDAPIGKFRLRDMARLRVSGKQLLPSESQANYRNVKMSQDTSCCGRSGVVVGLLASHLGEPGSIPGGLAPMFSYAGIVPDDAAGWQFLSGFFHFPCLFILVLLYTHLTSDTCSQNLDVSEVTLPGEEFIVSITVYSKLANMDNHLFAPVPFIYQQGYYVTFQILNFERRSVDDGASCFRGIVTEVLCVPPCTTHQVSTKVGILDSLELSLMGLTSRAPSSSPQGRRMLTIFSVLDNAAGRQVFSRISSFPRPFIPVLLHTHLNQPHWLSRPRC
ncbi:hypothetical protein PR048_030421 [Dryococelus australis]|uniref:Uncharacterized protein n=1 Tax=Dryococelus australis TaxID=614101 RepID=A0ABQ9G8X9_9NEOP|nr:hypothetical protein PR048_030421 [Dryococelus australis]